MSSLVTEQSTLPWKVASYFVAGVVFFPILLIFLQWGNVGSGEQVIWQHLLDTQLERLLGNTLILFLGVGVGVAILGVSLAWLTSVCEFPGRRLFDWALMLPLAIPGYVMAFVFLGLLNFAGPVQTAFRGWFGADVWFPDVQGAPAVILIFSLVLYPYVYMLARSAFIAQGRSMMDAARVLGLNPWQAFIRVAVPIARPAIVAGVALALMETLADFGAVSVFNYDTFTTAIYSAWYGLFNLAVAAQLATLLLLFVALTLFMEKQGRQGARYTQDERSKVHRAYRLQGLRAWGATALCSLVLLLAFLLPLGQLISWCIELTDLGIDSRFFSFLGHTLGLGALAAILTVIFSLLL
ncbi:MAG: ABC transporter permease subunit, partial [Pseudohongiellaceae bacterium]